MNTDCKRTNERMSVRADEERTNETNKLELIDEQINERKNERRPERVNERN